MNLPILEKSCGSCTACCKAIGVKELNKPMGEQCGFCNPGKGCSIYETRPQSCQDYKCQWLMDPKLPDYMRPDRIKVIIDECHHTLTNTQMLQIRELARGAAHKPLIKSIIDRFSQTHLITIFEFGGGRRLTGPPDMVDQVKAEVQRILKEREKK